jgi:hypothetical protein
VWNDNSGTCKEKSQPCTKFGITQQAWRHGGIRPPRLEGRGIHNRAGRHVFTLVSTGRSAGVGEEERRGSSARRKTVSTQRMQKMGVCAVTAGPAPPHGRLRASRRQRSHGRLLASFTPSPDLDVTGGAGMERTPSWLGFGGEAPAAYLIAGGR